MRTRALVSKSGRMTAVLSVVALLMVFIVPAAVGKPPGNNGTVKVDGIDFDDHPNNEPHVGCIFQIDFYGFDKGDLYADVTFEAQQPTGTGVLLTDVVFIGEDAAGGGTDLDAALTVDLSAALSGFEPHPKQGFHVKLTVNAEGSIGADTKFKVFWVEGCDPSPPTTTTVTKPPTTTAPVGTGTIIIEKYALPFGDKEFSFTGGLGDFTIVDNKKGTGNVGSQETFVVDSATYTVVELVPSGWRLADISCTVTGTYGTSVVNVNVGLAKVTIHLTAGDSVYCDFRNLQEST